MSADPLSFRGPVLLGLVALVVLFVGFGSWAFLARLEGAIVLRGQVVVDGSRQLVQHPDGGVVAEVLVREGSVVVAGDPLLRLEDPDLVLETRIAEARLSELYARKARLVAERDESGSVSFAGFQRAGSAPDAGRGVEMAGQVRLFALRLSLFQDAQAMLAQRIMQMQAQASGLAAEAAALEVELALVEEELSVQEALLQAGLVAQSPVRTLAREAARLRAQIAELAVARAGVDGQIAEAELRIVTLRTERIEAASTELRDIAPVIAELEERLAGMDARIDRLVIRAPVSGVVLGLKVPKPEVVLLPAAEILSLIPQSEPLVIAAELAPEAVDGVFPGQSAEIAISALGSVSAPRLQGKVTMVAADTTRDPDSGAVFYRVELALDPGEIDRLTGRPLVPGMRVEAFLATGARRPIAYLLEPFVAFFDHAMREG